MRQKVLHNLNPKEYEHAFDRKALNTLERTPGLEKVSKFIVSQTIERIYTVQYTGSNIQITRRNYPDIYKSLEEACEILGVRNIPDLYLSWGYSVNGFTTGAEKPLIVLNSGTIDLLDKDELLYVIGHEVGHIKSLHMLYHMMAQVFTHLAGAFSAATLGLGGLITEPIKYALYHWYRMSEFTADRAGLLTCQDQESAIKAMMKMAGMPVNHFHKMNYEAFLDQARNFEMLDENHMNKAFKFISTLDNSHPWTVMRAAELIKWIESGEYGKIIGREPRASILPNRNMFNGI